MTKDKYGPTGLTSCLDFKDKGMHANACKIQFQNWIFACSKIKYKCMALNPNIVAYWLIDLAVCLQYRSDLLTS